MRIFAPRLRENATTSGNSSVGRAQPCQGWGREFESRFPLLMDPRIYRAQVAEW